MGDARIQSFCLEMAALLERYGVALNVSWGYEETSIVWPVPGGFRHFDIPGGFGAEELRAAVNAEQPGDAPAMA